VEKTNLHDFYNQNITNPKSEDLFRRMVSREVDGKITEQDMADQFEICGYYLVFAFRKKGHTKKRYRDDFGNIKAYRMVNVKDWR